MDTPTSLRRKSTSLLSRSSNQSLTKSNSIINAVLLKRKSTGQPAGKPNKLRKNPTRDRRKPKPIDFEAKVTVKKVNVSPRHSRKDCLFPRLSYLSVRNDNGSYFLCRALQNIYKDSTKFRAQWLDYRNSTKDYGTSYLADLTPDTVLTAVHMVSGGKRSYKLRDNDRIETERLLGKSINKSKGLDVSDEESEGEDEEDDEPPAKKKKRESTKKKTTNKKAAVKKEKKPRAKKAPADKVPRKRKPKKDAVDLELHPNTKIKVLDKDPFFETKEKVPYVSKHVNSKLVIRAILLNDIKLLKKTLQDKDKIFDCSIHRSVATPKSALHYAVEKQNVEALDLMKKFYRDNRHDRRRDVVMVNRLTTGSYNPRSLNVSHIRQIMVSRGTREGTNALTKDLKNMTSSKDLNNLEEIEAAIKAGVDWKFIEKRILTDNYAASLSELNASYCRSVFKNIIVALGNGDRKLGGNLIKWAAGNSFTRFTNLHHEVLLGDGDDLNHKINQNNVTSQPKEIGCTPIHCAALNPHVKYLEALLKASPDINSVDYKQKSPVHYAAVCQGTGPLELLLKMGASGLDVDRTGVSPLHMACETGRQKNVEILLSPKVGGAAQAEMVAEKYGTCGINRPNKNGYQAIHLAVENGHKGVVDVLLKHGVKIDAELSISKFRLTPLMLAAGNGHYDLVKHLVGKGATVRYKDRLGRTALIHSVMNGHTHISSYLLNIGEDPNTADSSGNTAMHYSAAYGWPHVTSLLLEAGGDPNTQNLWKVSPVSIAWLKGHKGIVSILLDDDRVDVNFKDDKGQTLVHIAASSPLAEDLFEQIRYLIEDKKGDPCIVSAEGDTALSILMSNDTTTVEDGSKPKDIEKRKLKIAEYLVKHGCPVDTVNSAGRGTLNLAITSVSVTLCEFLIKEGAKLTSSADEKGNTVLHHMAELISDKDITAVLKLLLKKRAAEKGKPATDFTGVLKEMAAKNNHQGYSPLLLAVQHYTNTRCHHAASPTEQREIWKQRRQFLILLIEELGADVSAVVGKVFYPEDPENKSGNSEYGGHGKMSCVDYLVNFDRDVLDGARTEPSPALKLLLSHKPNLNIHSKTGSTPLILAVKHRLSNVVDLLIKHGANVNMPEFKDDKPYCYPLSIAVASSLPLMAADLLKHGADVNMKSPETGEAPIHQAVVLCSYEETVNLVKVLIKAKCNLNIKDKKGRTPLHRAISKNDGSINASNVVEELLIKAGADVFAKDDEQRMPVQYVFLKIGSEYNHKQFDPIEQCRMMAVAMDYRNLDAKDIEGQTVLHRAASRGAYLCCTYLLQKAAYLNVSIEDVSGTTPLGYAVYYSHDNCACMMIQHEPAAVTKDIVIMDTAELDAKKKKSGNDSDDSDNSDMSDNECSESDVDSDDSDNTDDSDARRKRHRKDDKKEKKDEKPLWMWNPLRKTVEVTGPKHIHIFQRAIEKELQGVSFVTLELPVEVSGLEYAKAVSIAMSEMKFNVALRLIGRAIDKTALTKSNADGQNLLHHLALKSAIFTSSDLITKTINELLEHGVNLKAVDKYGREPIYYAAYNHNFSLAKEYLAKMKNFDGSSCDKFGRNILSAVLWKHKTATNRLHDIKEFFSKLKKVSFDGLFDFPLPQMMYGSRQSQDVSGDFFKQHSTYKCTPLIQSISFGSFEFCKYLLANKASVNLPDSDSIYPLMHAVRKNNVTMVKLLLDQSYDPDKEREAIQAEKMKETKKKQQAQNVFSLKRVATVNSDNSEEEEEEEEEEMEDEEENKPEEKIPGRKDFRAVPWKSKINLNAQDPKGWTALHHCVQPLELGSFDNAEIAWVLLQVGANINVKNKQGQTPLEMALKVGAEKVALVIQEHMKVKENNWKVPVLSEIRDNLDDRLVWKFPPPDYDADATAYLDKIAANNPNKERQKPSLEVDERCNIKDTGELVMDPNLKLPYSALLTVVDVAHGYWGLYNFYKLQLVHQKGKDMYMLFTCWGRIGDQGQFQHTPFTTLEEAVKEFCKIYRAKSGNSWQNRNDEFVPVYKKYRLVTFGEEHPGLKQDLVAVDLKSTVTSKLPKHLQEVMKEFMNVTNLEAAINRKLDPDLMPFGRLKRDDLLKAKQILIDMGSLVKEGTKMLDNYDPTKQQELWGKYSKIGKLSSAYYQLIPQKGFAFEKIRPLSTSSDLEENLKLINNLLDYEMSTKMVLGACYRKKEINPMDYVYRALRCQMKLLNENDVMTQYLLRYITATNNSPCVEAIYSLNREDEEPCDLGNDKLLFHGSGVANFIGILKQGLLVAPPGVQIAGASYGAGVYTSDAFSKSKHYTSNLNRESNKRFMLICKVSLGKSERPKDIYDFDRSRPSVGYDSLSVVHSGYRNSSDPKYDVKLPSGVSLPLGDPSSSSNEFIAFSPKQVALRYLIQFRH